MWQAWLAFLASLAADPTAIDAEHPRAAAACQAAYASMAVDAPGPAPEPESCVCGKTCVNGYWKPDGRILQPCNCTCERCQKKPGQPTVIQGGATCPDGKCGVPGVSPATVSPAKPLSGR